MTTAAMTASFTLKLEDQLSQGLNHLLGLLEKIAAIGGSLKLPAFDRATRKLDQVSAAANRVGNSVARIGETANAAGRSIAVMTAAAEGRLTRLARQMRLVFHAGGEFGRSVGVIGAVGAGVALGAPIREYAGYDARLRQIAVTEGLSGPAALREVARLDRIFRHDAIATRQTSGSIAEAALDLVQAGMPIDTVLGLLPAHSRAATAYRISPEALGQAVYALNMQFGIGHDDIQGALASMALASKSGKFNVEDFSHYLPAVGGAMKLLGMTGRGSADMAFAALETVRMNTGDSASAATNFADLLHYMTSQSSLRSFAGYSHMMDPITRAMYADGRLHRVNLPEVFAQARAHGVNPLMAFMQVLRDQVKGQTPDQMGFTLGRLLHNQQAGDAAKALIQNWDHFTAMMVKLNGVDIDTLTRDFVTMFDSPEAQLRLLGEFLGQLGRRIGAGLMPVLTELNVGLLHLIQWIDALDEKDRAWLNGVIELAGWLTVLVGVLGTIGFVGPAVASGFRLVVGAIELLAGGIGLLGAAVAAALVDIVLNWERFRDQLAMVWDGIKGILKGIADVFMGFVTVDGGRIKKGLSELLDGVAGIFTGIIGTIKQLLTDLWNTVASLPGAAALGITPIGKGGPAEPGSGMTGGERLAAPAQAHLRVDLSPGLRAQLEYLHGLKIGVHHDGEAAATGPTVSRP